MERKADRGAWSMLFSTARATKRQMVSGSPRGAGKSARKMALGRCVATMAWIRPILLASEAAKTLPMVEMNLYHRETMPPWSAIGDNIPSRRHDPSQLSLIQIKLPFQIKVDQREWYHPTRQRIQKENAT